MRSSLLLAIAMSIATVSTRAQSNGTYGLFPTIDHSGSISHKLAYSLYYFAGVNLYSSKLIGKHAPSEIGVFYGEQAIHYSIDKHWSVTGSYVYERQHPFATNYRNENRFYLQGTYKHTANRIDFKHRLRYDGRFIENRVTGETPYTSRVRYLFGISTPFGKTTNTYLTAYNEFFFNTYPKATVTYAENWAAAAIGYKTKKAGNFEVGPLYIFWVNNSQYDLTNFLYLQLAWVTHIDFTKKEK